MKERRYYDRVSVGSDCVIYIGNSNTEYECVIKNISQAGIAFVCKPNDTVYQCLEETKYIKFSSFDAYNYFGTLKENPLIGVCELVRTEVTRDGFLLLGCKFKGQNIDIGKYVQEKKVSLYMKYMSMQRTIEMQSIKNLAVKEGSFLNEK